MIGGNLFKSIKSLYNVIRKSSLESLIWIVNLGPTLSGYGIYTERSSISLAILWIIQFALLIYVYSVTSVAYIIIYAESFIETIQSYFNILGNVLIFNCGFWMMNNRSNIRKILKLIKVNDVLARTNERQIKKLKTELVLIKKVVVVFYFLILVDACIHFPEHDNLESLTHPEKYAMIKCVGLHPVTKSPNYEVCITILITQGYTMVCMVVAYKTMLILLVTHTTTMYKVLAQEIMFITHDNSKGDIKTMLPMIAYRHSLILKTVKCLQSLYKVPTGVDVSANALCICLTFIVPLSNVPKFMTTSMYSLADFFLYCFLCQKLENASEVFEKAIYNCGWENMNHRDQKSIFIMLVQAQKPISIKAAGIIPLRMYTFASTLQTIYKFGAAFKI